MNTMGLKITLNGDDGVSTGRDTSRRALVRAITGAEAPSKMIEMRKFASV